MAAPTFEDKSEAPEQPLPHPESPCIKTCRLGDDSVCQGCYRSIEEISAWPMMTAEQKLAALEASGIRRSAGLLKDS